MTDINVESIVKEVRAEIKETGFTKDTLDWEDVKINEDIAINCLLYDEGKLVDNLSYLNNNNYIAWGRPLQHGIKGFAQRIIRKLGKFMIVPFAEGQNRYNQATKRCLEQLVAAHMEERRALLDCEKRLESIEKLIDQALAQRL